jgi:hypothetical protein
MSSDVAMVGSVVRTPPRAVASKIWVQSLKPPEDAALE